MVGGEPRGGAVQAVVREEQDQVLAPDAPAREVAHQREGEGDAGVVPLARRRAPGGQQDDGFGGVGAGPRCRA